MADVTPLLSSADPEASPSSSQLVTPLPIHSPAEGFVGDNSRSEPPQFLLQALLVSFAWFFDAQQTFIAIFTDFNPKWHCTRIHGRSCDSAVSSICQIPKDSWAWDSPPHSSIVSEWDLQCASSFFSALPASSFFMGCLVGGLALATLADSSLGRKNTLLLSCLIMSFSSLLTALSPNVWIYSGLRFLSGFGRGTIGACALVLSTELVGKRWRSRIGVTGFFGFMLGFLSLPALAYARRGSSWRNMYMCTSIPAIVYCMLLQVLVGESPRWVAVRGLGEEAATSGGEKEREETSMFSAMKMMLSRKWCVGRVWGVMTVSFGAGMAYYGMPLGVGKLGVDVYVSVAVNAVSELPAAVLTLLVMERVKRRGAVVGLTAVSGICGVMCGMKGEGWERMKIGLETVSFLSACTVVNVVMIFTVELFPTCVRNSAMAMVREAVVMGGVVGSMVAGEGWCYAVFGVGIAGCGVWAACLPETRGRAICDTMEEEETRLE